MAETAEKTTTPTWEAIDLRPFLRREIGDESAPVTGVRQLVGGASRDLWTFKVETGATGGDAAAVRQFVVRRHMRDLSDASTGIEIECGVMSAAYEAGVRLPRPYYHGVDADGFPFFIMDFVEGETLAPRLFRREAFADARGKIARQLGEFLAPIHRIDCQGQLKEVLGEAPTENPAKSSFDQYVENYRRIAANPHPVFELAFRYLEERMPRGGEICLVHGDYRLGNVVFGPEGIRSILDWELAHYGDPMEDLAWTVVRAWRFGHDDKPVAGLGSREELHAGYRAAGGGPIDLGRAKWWEVYGNLRWGIITLMQGSHFLNRSTRDLEKGAIGRRAVEVEAELLYQIQE